MHPSDQHYTSTSHVKRANFENEAIRAQISTIKSSERSLTAASKAPEVALEEFKSPNLARCSAFRPLVVSNLLAKAMWSIDCSSGLQGGACRNPLHHTESKPAVQSRWGSILAFEQNWCFGHVDSIKCHQRSVLWSFARFKYHGKPEIRERNSDSTGCAESETCELKCPTKVA